MGTWDVGPFDNDTAADFCGGLDDAAAEEREGLVRAAFTSVIDTEGYLDACEAEAAVAAAALVAAQCPGGDPAYSAYAPGEPLPDLTGLREPAVRAVDRVVTEPSELLELWEESDAAPWHAVIRGLRSALLSSATG
ncbi:DUF4259 domain-containing protein [Streptomyces tagetis]|uniref:DUF4259 domain-containing protein n=1 Tax=Streptomyces tagetis TaxID=2820809 RepID=A0A940XRF4_9ACTN|nr:DUF4259 domain-containing protein [Streptomyces sp. RG38]MBQ0829439.1 DUF4259 domain-containing protein [Streptomyces sp. RG38]